MKKKRLSKVVPTDTEWIKLPLTPAAKLAYESELEALSKETGLKLNPVSLLSALFVPELLKAAAESLKPKIMALHELEKQKRELGLYFLD